MIARPRVQYTGCSQNAVNNYTMSSSRVGYQPYTTRANGIIVLLYRQKANIIKFIKIIHLRETFSLFALSSLE
jgi:hypothetical protein